MKRIIKRTRPINLLLIALLQAGVYYRFIPLYHMYYQWAELVFFILFTVSLTIGGYIINDILDEEIDQVNDREKFIPVGWEEIWFYRVLFLVGFVSAWKLNVLRESIYFIPIYILLWLVLYAYSKYLKCYGVLGNLVVAVLSVAVVPILFVGLEWQFVLGYDAMIVLMLSYFIILGFFISLIRELVKDIEDMEGDKRAGCRSLAVEWGAERTKIFILFMWICCALAGAVYIYLFYTAGMIRWTIGSVVMFGLLLLAGDLIRKAKALISYTRLSVYLKLLMFLGMIYLVFL